MAPDTAWVLALVGQAWNSLGERDAARRFLIQAVRRGFVPHHLVRNPALHWLEGDPEFQRALADVSSNPDSRSPTPS